MSTDDVRALIYSLLRLTFLNKYNIKFKPEGNKITVAYRGFLYWNITIEEPFENRFLIRIADVERNDTKALIYCRVNDGQELEYIDARLM